MQKAFSPFYPPPSLPELLLYIDVVSLQLKLFAQIRIPELRLVPGKIGFLTWGRRGRRRVNPEEVILEESPQVPLELNF